MHWTQSNQQDEFSNRVKCYRARRLVPGAMIQCRHGVNPACECVQRFGIDKTCPLTSQYVAIVRAASFELDQMKELNIQHTQRVNLLTQIIQCEVDDQRIYTEEYQSTFGPLLVSPEFDNPIDDLPTSSQNHKHLYIYLIVFIVSILFLMTAVPYSSLH